MDGLHRQSGRNASPSGITPSTIMSPIRTQHAGSRTEIRLGARAHTTDPTTNRAHAPPADQQPVHQRTRALDRAGQRAQIKEQRDQRQRRSTARPYRSEAWPGVVRRRSTAQPPVGACSGVRRCCRCWEIQRSAVPDILCGVSAVGGAWPLFALEVATERLTLRLPLDNELGTARRARGGTGLAARGTRGS